MTGVVVVPAVIYLRVSTEEQAKRGYSLPEQREACRLKAQTLARDLEASSGQRVELITQEFVDDFSGDILERPVLEQVRAHVEAHRPRWFICMDPDRYARDLMLQLIVTDHIEKAGTSLVFVQHNYEKTPEGLLFYQLRGAISQFEKAKILERTARGKRGKVKAGKRPNGAAPFGYRHDKETDQLEVYEPEAQWVRQMFQWVAGEQLTVYQVTQRLNGLGVPTKLGARQWRRSTVAELLRNTSYIGQMRCNRFDSRGIHAVRRLPREKRRSLKWQLRPQAEWLLVPVPAILEPELFQEVQCYLATITRRGGKRNTGLLSMLVRCGLCGGTMGYSKHSHSNRYYLKCYRRYADLLEYTDPTRCTNPHHHADRIEREVWAQLTEWLSDPGLLTEFLTQQQAPADREILLRSVLQERGLLQQQLDEKRREQSLIISKQLKGLLTDTVADAMLLEIRHQVQEIEGSLADSDRRFSTLQEQCDSIAAATTRFRETADAVASSSVQVRSRMTDLPVELRRELVLKLVRQVTIYPDGGWTIVPY